LIISSTEYLAAIDKFKAAIYPIHLEKKFDVVVAPKRSGLFIGVVLSHALTLPMFLPDQLRKRKEFNKVLFVDTCVHKGTQSRKYKSQLWPREVFTAVIWQEGTATCDFMLYPNMNEIVKFWYEVKNV
jgi:hypothetical protein